MALPAGPTKFNANTLIGNAFKNPSNPKPMAPWSQKFFNAAGPIAQRSARSATDVSRSIFQSRLSGRPIAPPRPGRPTTGGQFAQFINWKAVKRDVIDFDLIYLETAAPYWAIQEIGTNNSARIIDGPMGPGAVTVRSQRGRRISANLVWASGLGGQASPASRGAGNEQLFLRAQVLANNVVVRRMRINREIHAKHYLRDGAKSGFKLYRKEMEKAFRQSYK